MFSRKGVLSVLLNMQQIRRRIPMPKCDFTLRLGCFPVNLLRIFRTSFSKNHPGGLLLFIANIKKTMRNFSVDFHVLLSILKIARRNHFFISVLQNRRSENIPKQSENIVIDVLFLNLRSSSDF